MRPMFVLNYRSAEAGVSGLWGPFSTRGEADFFAHQLAPRGTWTIETVRSPTDIPEQ